MEISNFELVYKPQSPVGPADTVLQGYFLSVTNLEEVALRFRATFVTSAISDPDRTLAGNATAFVDLPDGNNIPGTLVASATGESFRLDPDFVVPPKGTAKIALLPSDPFTDPGGPANFECRGYVTLRLPFRFSRTGGLFGIEPQLDRPARVMVTPTSRATYFGTNGQINSQTQAGLPTGFGGAVGEIPPDNIIVRPPLDILDIFRRLESRTLPEMTDLDLFGMLAAIGASEMDFNSINAAMKEAGIGMALERRKS